MAVKLPKIKKEEKINETKLLLHKRKLMETQQLFTNAFADKGGLSILELIVMKHKVSLNRKLCLTKW